MNARTCLALLAALLAALLDPLAAPAQPYETEAMARARAAAGDADGDPIDFADAERQAQHMVYRRDIELYAGRPHAEAAAVMAVELLDVYDFPLSPDPFADGLDQSAWTPAMAEALPIAIEGYRAGGDHREADRLARMRDRVAALDDVPAWALRCREGLLGLSSDPTPCEMLALTHAMAHGEADRRVVRLMAFARAITTGERPLGPLEAPHLELRDRIRAAADNAALALDVFDRQIAAGLTPLEAAAVLVRWNAGEINLSALAPPLPSDAGAWSTGTAEGVVLRAWLGRTTPAVIDTYGSLPQFEYLRAGHAAAFGALPLWSALDPPGGPADVPALAARCRHARIRAADDLRISLADCATLADVLAVAAGPFDPEVNALREAAGEAAGEPGDAALADLHRPRLEYREATMSIMFYELAGHALSWDAELAVGTSVEVVPELMVRYRIVDIDDRIGPRLIGPPPDGAAWVPALVDGMIAAVIGGQLDGEPLLGIGGLDAWAAVVSGPRGGPERDDLPALAARCRAGLMRWQLGHAARDPEPCIALADALEVIAGPTDPDVIGARTRAVMLSVGGERAAQQAALDAPWVAPAHPETRRARIRLMALGQPDATLYREDFVEFFDVDSEELLDEWARDLAAGLDSERAAKAVAARAKNWVRTVSAGLQPPFSADAGAWPGPMVEGLVSVVEIGRRLGRADWALGLLPALARTEARAVPERDLPALSGRCRMAEIRAMDDRPADDVEACERLYFAHAALLGPVHPILTDARLRLARLHASRGERGAALEWSAEAVTHWADPQAVDSTDEAVWAAARALRAWGEALAALGRSAQALEVMTAGRELAATTGYARLGDGLRYLGEEARVAADAGDRAAVIERLLATQKEAYAAEERKDAREAEDELDDAWVDEQALVLAGAGMTGAMGDALSRVLPPDKMAVTLNYVQAGWKNLDDAGLGEHPLAVELLALLARLQARVDGPSDEGRRAAHHALALQARLDRRTRPWLAPMAAAEVAHANGRGDVAIAWAKEAVDAAQAARAEVGALGPEAEQRFVEARVELYTVLGGWLIEAGRLVEADEVERRVGELRLAGLTRSSGAAVAREPVSRSAAEDAWRRRYARAAERLRAGRLGAEAFVAALDAAERRLVSATARQDATPGADDGLSARLASLGAVALLQIVMGADQIHLVLSTAKGRQTSVRPVDGATLNGLAHGFYRALRTGAPLAEVRRRGQALHRELLAPVQATLDAEGITTLMIAPGGALRYVPFAALQDAAGRYALEDRAIVRYPVLSPELLDGPPRRPACLDGGDGCIAAFGARVHGGGLGNLAFVPAELEGIVRRRLTDLDGRVAGALYLDDAFTAAALRASLSRGVPLVHVASHFVFHPGSATQSFLALGGGGRLDMQRLAGPDFPFDRVDLLTLSACETAVGTFAAGQPPDSFAALALSKGAGAVLASLWPVADDSTATLMRAFYGHLADGASKAEALRRAQLELMRGPAPRGASRKFGLPGVEVQSGAHPYAWAPFVLTGDWR